MADRDAIAFEPFFPSRQITYELKRLQTVPERENGARVTSGSPHADNGLCNICRAKWFRRLAQIIAEGIKGETARPGAGTPRRERLLPENAPRDGVHHTWYKPRKPKDPEASRTAPLRASP
jgi:hypothetical protein